MLGKRPVRRVLAILVVLIAAVVAFFVFYHPPMRLMPPPLLVQGNGAALIDLAPELQDGNEVDVFYASSRLPVGPRENRIYTVAPDFRLHLGNAHLTIGAEGSTLDDIYRWTTGTDTGDRPFIYLDRMEEMATLPEAEGDPLGAETEAWLAALNAELSKSRHKDILVYVHGANTTVERAAGQASQLRHFAGRNAVVVLFVWPTAENFLRYSRDIRNAFGSSPQLAKLIGLLARHTDAEQIDVMTYSAGATVGSDGLRLLAETDPEATAEVGEVYHAAPDADFRGFVDDLSAYAGKVGRVTAAVNLGDSALRLAALVNRGSRAGRPDLSELRPAAAGWLLEAATSGIVQILNVRPEDMPALPATSHTFWYDDPWVSNDLLLLLLFGLGPAERGLEPGKDGAGAPYWSFTPDYPERLGPVVEGLRANLP